MDLIFLEKYNNYFNRIIKKYDNDEIIKYITDRNTEIFHNIDFNPNDSIETTQIVNWTKDFTPDYMLLCDTNPQVIVSRWFVIEWKRTRGKQYIAKLRRDLIADYYDQVLLSPCFVEKGWVNQSSTLIYNEEPMRFNQIKKEETLLHDASKCSWLVMYYNLSKKEELVGTNVPLISSTNYLEISTPISEWYSDYQVIGYAYPVNKQFKTRIVYTPDSALARRIRCVYNNYGKFQYVDGTVSGAPDCISRLGIRGGTRDQEVGKEFDEALESARSQIKTALDTAFDESLSFSQFKNLTKLIVKDSTNKFYKIRIEPFGGEYTEIHDIPTGALLTTLYDAIEDNPDWAFDRSKHPFESRITYQKYRLIVTEITNEVESFDFDFSSCKDIKDQPFGIIAMPYNSYNDKPIYIKETSQEISQLADSRVPMAIVKELTKAGVGASKVIYDVQLLPYCPITYVTATEDDNGIYIDIDDMIDESDYTMISNPTYLNIALHPETCKFTTNLEFNIDVPNTAEEFKFANQCEFYRLCSPNFASIYEFNAAKNNGVNYFNVDCTYKPFQPYIHLNPNFKNLYGQDFNDPRGLICNGDFSITIVSDAWESYKLQNKNYEAIFNRQIESLDVQQSIQKINNGWQTATGAITGASAGVLAGSLGGPVGAIVGGVVGGATSLAGGIADAVNTDKLMAEQKDYAKDMYKLNLDNIQALPSTLSKIDSFNNNNKIFPILEKYSCTDLEKELFIESIKYSGMTIGCLGVLDEYSKGYTEDDDERTFVKGQMIRITDIGDDTHLLNNIYEEIYKGVYI